MTTLLSAIFLNNLVIKPSNAELLVNSPDSIIANHLKYPSNLLHLDDKLSHHVIVVEKSTHRLHLFYNEGSYPKYLKSYIITTGLSEGDKNYQGDHKTPEGIYQLIEFLPEKLLLDRYGDNGKQYGAGAFVMTYPNPIDHLNRKTGGGIWLHSTDDESRILKGLDSRGCVVMGNQDLKDISKYIELPFTSIIIVHDLQFLRKETWEKNRIGLKEVVGQWLKAWQEKDFKSYISYYHNKYFDSFRKSLSKFRSYKRAVFNNPGKPEISISNLSILATNEYATVQFYQYYKSKTLQDTGKKTLILIKDKNYQWKILNESWAKVTDESQVMFTPSMRFFN